MAKSIPAYSTLNDENAREAPRSDVESYTGLTELCDAFAEATGWRLRFEAGPEQRQDPVLKWSAPVNPGVGVALGHFGLDLGGRGGDLPALHSARKSAERLAASISDLLERFLAAQRTLFRREAELAAGVPVVSRAEDQGELAELLEAILRTGAEAYEAEAAALYMLDDGTSELKLRAAWGLPAARLMQPARPLEGAVADLEALLGHAVALERAAAFGPWRAPEAFPAALCVPVSTPTVPLGTLWFFSDREREFTDVQTGLAEMTSGRLAAELERVMLIAALAESRVHRR